MNNIKTYYFNNDSWYDVPSCDCCGYEDLMEVFNIDRDQHPDFDQNGSSLAVEDCFEDVLVFEGVLEDDWRKDDPDMNWEEEDLFLQELMEKNGLQIKIEKLDSPDEYDVYP